MGWFGKERSAIGVDLGSRVVKAVQMGRCKRGWRVEAAMVLPRVAGDGLAETVGRVCEALERQGFVGRQVVLAAPNEKLHVDMLELPPKSSGAPLEQIARVELARSGKMEVGEFEMACWDLPSGPRAGAGCAMMAVGIRRGDVEELCDVFEEQGYVVSGVDTAGWAVARAACGLPIACCLLPNKKGLTAAHCPSDQSAISGGMTAVVELGWKGGMLVLVNEGKVLYQRVLEEAGLLAVQKSVGERFDLSDEVAEHMVREASLDSAEGESPRAAWVRTMMRRHVDAIAVEVERSFSYAGHRYPTIEIKRVKLSGGGAETRGVMEYLAGRLGMETNVLRLSEMMECSEAALERCATPMLTVAAGLAWPRGKDEM